MPRLVRRGRRERTGIKMAQPNVAREPSMDEILASIRKIIENNEAQPDLAPDAQDDGFDITTESHSALPEHSAMIERFRMEEPRPAPVEPVIRHSEPAQPALSLADVAARVRPASERHVAAHREPVESEPVVPSPVSREESPLVTSRMSAGAGRLPSGEEPVARMEPVVEPALALVSDPQPAPIETADVQPIQQEEAAPTEVNRDIAALVSPAVGERVALSFGALAQAVDAGPRRSFDEIAEDMLRPMLQEWLDDNLPTLVERLVREEIERVARGSRR